MVNLHVGSLSKGFTEEITFNLGLKGGIKV